jgi:hypothetical protein
MPSSGFDRKDDQLPSNLTTDVAITDKDDLEEIEKIRDMLNPNEEVFVVARQSRLKPGGSKFTPNVVFATDRRIIIRDPSMLGLREDIVDIPYDMISSVRIDKGVFSSNIIFKAPGLINSSRRGKLDKLMMVDRDEIRREHVGEEEDGIITAIPKDKAEELLEVIRNGMDRDREVYSQRQEQHQQSPTSIADELTKLANLKKRGIISEEEFQQMKQDLIKKKL